MFLIKNSKPLQAYNYNYKNYDYANFAGDTIMARAYMINGLQSANMPIL